MELQPRSYEKIVQLMQKGVGMPNPLTLDIGPEVRCGPDLGGRRHPVPRLPHIRRQDRHLGRRQARRRGPGHHRRLPAWTQGGAQGWLLQEVGLPGEGRTWVRGRRCARGSILEEEANGAHCVGLKQTILFPFVTLGSLINFCDCLMAGGTSRKDHSEVGSSYIHFNFTPDGNKTTASLFGDVPRGVMLNQPPIFLGGQGGAVGPVRLGYGTVVAAGSVLRDDAPEDGRFIIVAPHPGSERDFVPHAYKNLARVVANNIVYLANLVALEQWYIHVRQPFFGAQELGSLVYEGALDMLALAKGERTKRLTAMVEKVSAGDAARGELKERIGEVCALFGEDPAASGGTAFLAAFQEATGGAVDGLHTDHPGAAPGRVRTWESSGSCGSSRACAAGPGLCWGPCTSMAKT